MIIWGWKSKWIQNKIAFNYIIDITEIVLYNIEICFTIRLQRVVDQILVIEKEKEPAPPPQVIIYKNIMINQNLAAGENDKTNQNDRSNQNIVGNF